MRDEILRANTFYAAGFAKGHLPAVRSVRLVQESPLLPDSFVATGFVYDVRTGRLRELD